MSLIGHIYQYGIYFQLLNGRIPDGEESPAIKLESTNPEDEVVILRSKLLQSEEVVKDLREELSNVKNECMQLHGVKVLYFVKL